MNRYYNILSENKKKFIYIPLSLYWIVLFIATSLPSKALPKIAISDKIEHLFAYLILGIFLYAAFKFQDKIRWIKEYAFLSAIFVIAFYGLFDELHQLLIPGRICDVWDWTADFIGGIIGISAAYIVIFKNKKRTVL